jgi:2-oxoglutarate dehydrogenase E2 component (dihydrolipoamide succinyltransferase)
MTIEIKVPVLPESVADASIATWHVKVGEKVSRDQNLVDIETDKVVLEVVAPADGVVSEIFQAEGETVLGEQIIANFEDGESTSAIAAPGQASEQSSQPSGNKGESVEIKVPVLPESVADATIATWHVKPVKPFLVIKT